jgi:hypothetical protein
LGACIAGLSAPSRAYAQDAWTHPAAEGDKTPTPQPTPLEPSDDGGHDTTVVVHIDSPRPVQLQREDAGGNWRLVCNAPCDLPVAEHRQYRLAGDGIKDSESFSLKGQNGRAVLDVAPASRGWFIGGIVMVSVGPNVLGVGALLYLLGAIPHEVPESTAQQQNGSQGLQSFGVATMVVGLGLTVAGAVAIATNASTSVTLRDPRAAPPSDAVGPAQPVWRSASAVEAALPTTFSVPVLQGSF